MATIKITIECQIAVNEDRWDVDGLIDDLNTQEVSQGVYEISQNFHPTGTIKAEKA